MNTLASNISWGVNGLIIGLSTVFLVLVVLIIAIILMQQFIGFGKKTKKIENPQETKPVLAQMDDDNDEIIAVISAVVACMAQREGKKFKIISFRKHKI